jgi:hypothetical protein
MMLMVREIAHLRMHRSARKRENQEEIHTAGCPSPSRMVL